MNFTDVKHGLQRILDAALMLTPLAKALGGNTVANIGRLIETGTSIANNALERIKDGTVVADARDEAVVKAILVDLQAANDALAKSVDAS